MHAFALVLVSSVIDRRSAHTQDGGAIAGRVTLTSRVRARLPQSAYPIRSVGKHAPSTLPEVRNVVVYVKGAAFGGALPTGRLELRQENETFLPHVVAITKGSSVTFPNADPFFHNVFSLSSAARFNLGRYPNGQTRTHQFNKPGLVKVYCEIHSHMSASILVLDHPYFAVPDADGTYEIANVPPGRHSLVGWHERVGERITAVQVQAGRKATVDLTVPVEDLR
jgi:plastocyanin